MKRDVPFNPNVKDGRAALDLDVPKSNWAIPLENPPFEAYAVTCGITFTFGGLRITNDAAGVQGAIRMASPFPNRHHPDFIKTQVLNNLFGGFFGSRLMSNIREDKGYTYGIYSYLENHLQDTAWVISTEAGRDVCEATIEEVYKEMKILRDEIVDADELLLVKNYMLGSILGDLDGPFHIINRWKNIILHGLPKDYFDTQIQTIKDVSAEELHSLANKYLQPESFYELVVV